MVWRAIIARTLPVLHHRYAEQGNGSSSQISEVPRIVVVEQVDAGDAIDVERHGHESGDVDYRRHALHQ